MKTMIRSILTVLVLVTMNHYPVSGQIQAEQMTQIKESIAGGKVDDAVEIIKTAKQLYPDSSKMILRKAIGAAIDEFQTGDRHHAIDFLEKSKPIFTHSVGISHILLQFYWYEFDREKCIQNCKATLELDSTDKSARQYLDALLFVPDSFKIPESLHTRHLFIRPLRISDVVLDYQAVMSSMNHIRGVFGPGDDWPQETLTLKDDSNSIKKHEREFARRLAFTYTVMNQHENECLGCIYICGIHSDPYDAQVLFWVTEKAYNLGYDEELYQAIQKWMKTSWPFKKIVYPGRNLDWKTYEAVQKEY